MVWIAKSYFTDSPNAASSSPMWVWVVLHPARPSAAAAIIQQSLEDMAIVLFELQLRVLCHSTDRPPSRRRRRWRRRRLDEGAADLRHACIGPAIDQQVGLVRRLHSVGR